MKRVLVIERHEDARVYVREDVRKKFNLSDEALQKLIDSGDEYEYEGRKVCFDIPDERAYS